MATKRPPQISRSQAVRYQKMSKADIVEAFRDIFREFGGEGELDDTAWMDDLERRIALLKSYREADAEVGPTNQITDNEPDGLLSVPGFGTKQY